MAIRIRRGTNAQRVPVVFELAEIAFTTDTKKFYIGDGTTAGGILIDDQSLTYNSATNTITTADGHTVIISNIPTITDVAHWNDAYDNTIISASITGDITKTLNLNQRDGGAVIVSYVDTYVHYQTTPNIEWNITHTMNKYPSVTIVDSAGSIVEGAVDYIDLNSCKITFCGAFSGKAYFN